MAAIFAPRSHGAAQDRDASEIRAVQTRQAEAWNRHDAKAYAELFEDDGDVVNVVGWWWKGRAEIESKLTAAFAHVFRESALTITEVEVRFLTPEIAVAHVRWTMTGARTPAAHPGAARRHTDPGPAQDRGPVADLGLPEHERGARDAVSHGATGYVNEEARRRKETLRAPRLVKAATMASLRASTPSWWPGPCPPLPRPWASRSRGRRPRTWLPAG